MNFKLSLKKILFLGSFIFLLAACTQTQQKAELQNPVLPGYFADPSLVQFNGKFYLYVTADPWGTDFLSCWESDDFQNWTFHTLNWPTKQACTSPTSRAANVWAPSVVQKGDKFYMYVSVGSEVWCGSASHPLGPWENMLADVPMIPDDTTGYYHVIDAEAFIDDDGRAYLYWGSGWNWKNGHCFAAELNNDMCTFKTEPVEVTPAHYFEGPLMVKNSGKYYLTYSEGKTIDDTYEVRYAVGDNPMGPFTEAANSPILKTNDSLQVYGPGHHTMFAYDGKNYILYHRHRLPFIRGAAFRQTCVNEYVFDKAENKIKNIIPFHTQEFPDLVTDKKKYIKPVSVSASSVLAEFTAADNVLDNSYATRWECANDDAAAELVFTFANGTEINEAEIRFEYPWKKYFAKIEFSANGTDWQTAADFTSEGVSGSPVNVPVNAKCSLLKITFVQPTNEAKPSVWELKFY